MKKKENTNHTQSANAVTSMRAIASISTVRKNPASLDFAFTKVRQNPVHPENPVNPDSALTKVAKKKLKKI